jgi:hypothetical protein
MTLERTIVTVAAVVALAAGLQAQATTTKTREPGVGTSATTSITGEVVFVERNWLLTKLLPNGGYRWFNVQPGRQFNIDGQTKLLADLKPGTVLTAVIVTTTQPVTVRTTSVLNGTVWHVSGNYVVLTQENGENREFNVPEPYRFMVEGKPASVHELRKGMKVSATKIVAEPQTEISEKVMVTGTAPK